MPVYEHETPDDILLELVGVFLGLDEDGEEVYETNSLPGTGYGEPYDISDHIPSAAEILVFQPTRTTSRVVVIQGANSTRPRVLKYEIERKTNAGAWTNVGEVNVDDPNDIDFEQSGLPTATSPENTFTYRVYGVNADGPSGSTPPAYSNEFAIQWAGTPVPGVTACTNFRRTGGTSTQAIYAWDETTPDPGWSITKHGLFYGNTLRVDNISAAARTYTHNNNGTAGSTHTAVNIRRWDALANGGAGAWSPSSNQITFNNPGTTPGPQLAPMLLGLNRGESNIGTFKPDFGRGYRADASNEYIDLWQAERIATSPSDVANTPTAITAEINRLKARAANLSGGRGYAIKIDYCSDNEADRAFGSFTDAGEPPISSWVNTQANCAAAARAAGAQWWGNFTYFGFKQGWCQQFSAGFQYLDGIAVNFYHPQLEQGFPHGAWNTELNRYMDYIAATGVTQVACYETGDRVDPTRPNSRPDLMTALVPLYQQAANARGLNAVAVAYWDPIPSYQVATRNTRLSLDAPLTLNAWIAAIPTTI